MTSIAAILSNVYDAEYGIGLITAVVPSTNNMLKRLEPTILPTAISVSFLLAATQEVTSSGRDVQSSDRSISRSFQILQQ